MLIGSAGILCEIILDLNPRQLLLQIHPNPSPPPPPPENAYPNPAYPKIRDLQDLCRHLLYRYLCLWCETYYRHVSECCFLHKISVKILQRKHVRIILIMPPTSKKLTGNTGFRLSVCLSVCPFVTLFDLCHILRTVHARVLKFHMWISLGKISCPLFPFLSELSPFLELGPFDKIRMKPDACHILQTVHARVWNFIHGFIMEK